MFNASFIDKLSMNRRKFFIFFTIISGSLFIRALFKISDNESSNTSLISVDIFQDPKGYQLMLPSTWSLKRRAQGDEHIRADFSDDMGGGVLYKNRIRGKTERF